jgi:hypothetical protein
MPHTETHEMVKYMSKGSTKVLETFLYIIFFLTWTKSLFFKVKMSLYLVVFIMHGKMLRTK